MKLRNKKTGKVYNACNICFGESLDDLEKTQWKTLKEFCEDWEDVKEPLIKDDKIRKAVRACADANGLNYMNCYESAHAWYLRAFNSREQGIDIEFWGYQLPKGLKDSETYTIVELCGEEQG